MSDYKAGSVSLSPQELRRREEAAARDRESKEREEKLRRDALERARRTDEVKALVADAERKCDRIRRLGGAVPAFLVPGAAAGKSRSLDELADTIASLREANKELDRILQDRQNSIAAEIEALNRRIDTYNAQAETVRHRTLAQGLSVDGVPPMLPRLDPALGSDPLGRMTKAEEALQLRTGQLQEVGMDLGEGRAALEREAIRTHLAPPSSPSAPARGDELEEAGLAALIREVVTPQLRSALLSELERATEKVGDQRKAVLGLALEDAKRIREWEDARPRYFALLLDAETTARKDAHELDAAAIVEPFAELHDVIAAPAKLTTLGEALQAIDALQDFDARLADSVARAEAAAGLLEANRRAAAFRAALEHLGYRPVGEQPAEVRIPIDGRLGLLSHPDREQDKLLHAFESIEAPEQQILIFQDSTDPKGFTAIAGRAEQDLVERVATGAATPDGVEPEWVEDWCSTGLPEAQRILSEAGYEMSYRPWPSPAEAQDEQAGQEVTADDAGRQVPTQPAQRAARPPTD